MEQLVEVLKQLNVDMSETEVIGFDEEGTPETPHTCINYNKGELLSENELLKRIRQLNPKKPSEMNGDFTVRRNFHEISKLTYF